MKIYAIMNWANGEPKITAIDMLAAVATERRILEVAFENIKPIFAAQGIRCEIVEFIAKQKEDMN